MKMPNGFGSVYKLSGKRRHPWVASKTFGWEIDINTGNAKQIQKAIGYYATRQEAMTALVNFNTNPYDIDAERITFADVYEKWSASYFPTLGSASSIRTITAIFIITHSYNCTITAKAYRMATRTDRNNVRPIADIT